MPIAIVKQIRMESTQKNYAVLQSYVVDEDCMSPVRRPLALPRRKLLSSV
jgi:hypothetical protein